MKICDAHLHYGISNNIWSITQNSVLKNKYPCYSTVQYDSMNKYEELFEKHNVEKSVLVPFVFREQDALEESQIVLDFSLHNKEKYYPYMYLDEFHPEFFEKNCNKFIGVKEHIVRHDSILTNEKSVIFDIMAKNNMILLLHSQRDRRIEYIKKLLKYFPGLIIQVAHMGRGLQGDTKEIYNILNEFKKEENIIFDTSTTRNSKIIEDAVAIVGSERILYGSDLPFYIENENEDIMAKQIEQIVNANILSSEKDNIFYNNFNKWIRRGE